MSLSRLCGDLQYGENIVSIQTQTSAGTALSQRPLSGKVAVVTGASKGIGAGVAKLLAARGAAVVVNYASSRYDADRVVSAIEDNGGKAIAVCADLANDSDIQHLFDATRRAYGRLDILVNNAGRYEMSPLETVTRESIGKMFDVNVGGLLLASKAAVAMFPEGTGHIVNIGSVVGEMAPGMASIYVGTKGAVNSITRSLARELGPRGIRVNAVNPGPVLTEGFRAAGFAGEIENSMVQNTPLGRVGQPIDIASVVAFLVSDEANWVTGSLLDAAGGWR